MFRITDLQSGMAVDIYVRDVTGEAFLEQLDRGAKKPKNRVAFLRRLEQRIALAIEESLDLSLQPPRREEEMEAGFRAMMQNLSIPREAFRRRTTILKFLRENPRNLPFDDSPLPPEGKRSRPDGQY